MTGRKSRTATHREDKRKAHGIHYTPPELAAFLAAEGLKSLGEPPRRVLDPACGAGELLSAVAAALDESSRRRLELVGLDTDSGAIELASARCRALGVGSMSIEQADFLRVVPVKSPELSLFAQEPSPLLEPVDLAIANPPYVRTQTLGSERVAEIVRAFGIAGRVDLYQAFAFAMTLQLRVGGVLALLCPNRFLLTRAGESLRRLLAEQYTVDLIVDLGDTRLFEAAVLPAVIIGTKTGKRNHQGRYVSIYEERGGAGGTTAEVASSVLDAVQGGSTGLVRVNDRTFAIRRGALRPGVGPQDAWTLQDDRSKDFLARVREHTSRTFGDIAPIRVGIKTTADKVFIHERDEWASLATHMRPEDDVLHPLLSNDEAERWQAAQPTRRVLYPHIQVGNRCRPIDLTEFPRAQAYLESHRVQLEGREYVLSAGRKWFEIWVPQKPADFRRRKVVFPDIAEDPRFFVDDSGAIVNGDCYWMAVDDEDLAHLITAIGNSKVAKAFYDAACGNVLYSGRRRFMTQYVEQFPLPPQDRLSKEIIVRAKKFAVADDVTGADEFELDLLIAESFGLKEIPG